MVFDKKHEIFGVLSVRPFSKVIVRCLIIFHKPGNVVGVRVCARFPGWTIMAKSGFLVVELGPKLSAFVLILTH